MFLWEVKANMLPSHSDDILSVIRGFLYLVLQTIYSIFSLTTQNSKQEIHSEISHPTSRWIIRMLKKGHKVQSAMIAKQGLIFSTVCGKRVAELSVKNQMHVDCLSEHLVCGATNLLTAQECANQMLSPPGVTMQLLHSFFALMGLHTDDGSWFTQGMYLLLTFW